MRSGKPRDRQLNRFAAAVITPLVIALAGQYAGPMERLLFAVAISAGLSEVIRWSGLDARAKWGKWLAWHLPLYVPLFAFLPYWSMVGYFFGFDLGIMAWSAVAVLSYTFIGRPEKRAGIMPAQTVLTAASTGLMVWFAVNARLL